FVPEAGAKVRTFFLSAIRWGNFFFLLPPALPASGTASVKSGEALLPERAAKVRSFSFPASPEAKFFFSLFPRLC
ncbi:hypothetical protein ACD591_19805, partial [Rufibacter glacialis]